MNAEERLNKFPSSPISNLLSWEDYLLHNRLYLETCEKRSGSKCIEQHKIKLGRQSYCWNSSYRNWVWEIDYGEYFLRIFVNDTQGASLEIGGSQNSRLAMAAFIDYYSRMMQ